MTTHPAAVVPNPLFTDPEAESRWRARFSAPRMSAPSWAENAPERNLYLSNAGGVWEVYAWDRSDDFHRKVTDRPNGTSHYRISPDGESIWWFADEDGDEFGLWVSEPFTADGRDAWTAVEGVPAGYSAGLEIGEDVTAVGVSTDDGTSVWLSRKGGAAEVVYSHENDGGLDALSKDETLLVLSHSEHGDSRHPALRVLSVETGAAVAEKWDGEGKGLGTIAFSPVLGDNRVLVLHERRSREELLLWDVEADTESEIVIDLPGEIVADWYPDATALLVVHTFEARNTLYRYHLMTGELSRLDTPHGTVGAAAVRPDGTVEYSWSSAAHPSVIRALSADGSERVLLEAEGAKAPGSQDVADVFVDGPGGRVHALVARPAGAPDGPLPTVFSLHGGPQSADEDRFSGYRAVWLDAGFAVVHVNYRGSTGYGSTWRDAIEGRPGLTELADVAAVHDWAVETGFADPAKCVVNGASWGGYLSLLALGTQPERWAVGTSMIPVADYLAAYEDEMEPLRAFDRALFGGSPEELPELYRECSPLTYVDAVRAPVLVLAGENDPRCPIRQIDNYLDRLAERGAEYEVYRWNAGHGSLVIEESLKQTAAEVSFALRHLPS
ncbi:prolyl oligopeptidase family serine peptidase [Umezawaea endophytica]|uniref:Prolyl oligopeptidase family serine peptidase n=1 Tax=Umezawaea endophytica TaxID=1654476 RepID=A0A9X2VVZ2_9PSEU|nr:prolyl oligopeptidase family serine peptidase [Umezawaea endophytica]MCS7483402.1 prolyl oligopeptidase family serine peptidase [Umezawaea endophytica]